MICQFITEEEASMIDYSACRLCPHMCQVDRTITKGFCGCGPRIKAARAALHMWEEPCISGKRGSGTIFFSGCTLRCCFCQNYTISSEGYGTEISENRLADIFLELEEKGAHNINLVSPTPYIPSILHALDQVKHRLSIPVVFNCGGYEQIETLDLLKGYVDIYLPDFKYFSPELSLKYSKAADYFSAASKAIPAMISQTGSPVMEEDPDSHCLLMKRGVIIRHLVLPGQKEDSKKLLDWIAGNLPKDSFFISLLSQYTPFHRSKEFPEINRRITSYEYNQVLDHAIALGLDQGFMQEKSSAKEEYTPPFNLEGILP